MAKFDLVVIGSGPGGEGAAIQAAKKGLSVAMVERYSQVGGGSTHWGTIPSKALRHSVEQIMEVRNSPLFRPWNQNMEVGLPQILSNAQTVIEKQVRMRKTFYERNQIKIFNGQAVFTGTHSIEIQAKDSLAETLEFKNAVIATGARPYRPPEIDFNHPRILDSDTILKLNFTPKSITIYGAGVIGCEYASIFRSLDIKVNLVNTRDKLLAFLDDEITDALAYHLREQGILIRHNEEFENIEASNEHVILNLKSGKKLRSDVLLMANGRTGNTEILNLEKIGIAVNHRGQIMIDQNHRTAQGHIYATGDVIGGLSLSSAAYDQGRFATLHFIEGLSHETLLKSTPTGIYTSPEISSLGKTEKELTAEKVPYEVGHSLFKSLARAQITGHSAGMLKILFHRESLKILGIHCFGAQASEIIHIGQAVMSQEGQGNTLRYFIENTFNYPTMAEAYRVAALNGINRIF